MTETVTIILILSSMVRWLDHASFSSAQMIVEIMIVTTTSYLVRKPVTTEWIPQGAGVIDNTS
jgi:hypothetical protein